MCNYRFKSVCFVLVLAVLLPFLLIACSPVRQSKTYFDLFDTVIEISSYGQESDFAQTCQRIYEELSAYHKLYDIYTQPADDTVTLYTVNERAGTAPVSVDARIFDLLDFCQAHMAQTENTVQSTYGAVLSLWHTARETKVLPTATELALAMAHTDPADLILDKETQTVYFADPDLKLDVGAVAKGYAVERVAEQLSADGVTGYLINAGGNVRAIGEKQADTPWKIGITAPDGTSALGYLSLTDSALVTSGSYHRFLEVDGVRYSHIIDPTTGMPADRYVSVTVNVADSDVGDLLSTALFLLPEQEGRQVAARFGAEVLWVYADGTTAVTNGFVWEENG